MGVPAPGAGLRQRDDLLAAAAGLAEGGGLASVAQTLLERLEAAEQIDWSRASLDTDSVAAKKGAKKPGPIRPIGASPAPSATSWWTGAGSRWRST